MPIDKTNSGNANQTLSLFTRGLLRDADPVSQLTLIAGLQKEHVLDDIELAVARAELSRLSAGKNPDEVRNIFNRFGDIPPELQIPFFSGSRSVNPHFDVPVFAPQDIGSELQITIPEHYRDFEGIAHGGLVASILEAALSAWIENGKPVSESADLGLRSTKIFKPVEIGRTYRLKFIRGAKNEISVRGYDVTDPQFKILAFSLSVLPQEKTPIEFKTHWRLFSERFINLKTDRKFSGLLSRGIITGKSNPSGLQMKLAYDEASASLWTKIDPSLVEKPASPLAILYPALFNLVEWMSLNSLGNWGVVHSFDYFSERQPAPHETLTLSVGPSQTIAIPHNPVKSLLKQYYTYEARINVTDSRGNLVGVGVAQLLPHERATLELSTSKNQERQASFFADINRAVLSSDPEQIEAHKIFKLFLGENYSRFIARLREAYIKVNQTPILESSNDKAEKMWPDIPLPRAKLTPTTLATKAMKKALIETAGHIYSAWAEKYNHSATVTSIEAIETLEILSFVYRLLNRQTVATLIHQKAKSLKWVKEQPEGSSNFVEQKKPDMSPYFNGLEMSAFDPELKRISADNDAAKLQLIKNQPNLKLAAQTLAYLCIHEVKRLNVHQGKMPGFVKIKAPKNPVHYSLKDMRAFLEELETYYQLEKDTHEGLGCLSFALNDFLNFRGMDERQDIFSINAAMQDEIDGDENELFLIEEEEILCRLSADVIDSLQLEENHKSYFKAFFCRLVLRGYIHALNTLLQDDSLGEFHETVTTLLESLQLIKDNQAPHDNHFFETIKKSGHDLLSSPEVMKVVRTKRKGISSIEELGLHQTVVGYFDSLKPKGFDHSQVAHALAAIRKQSAHTPPPLKRSRTPFTRGPGELVIHSTTAHPFFGKVSAASLIKPLPSAKNLANSLRPKGTFRHR